MKVLWIHKISNILLQFANLNGQMYIPRALGDSVIYFLKMFFLESGKPHIPEFSFFSVATNGMPWQEIQQLHVKEITEI